MSSQNSLQDGNNTSKSKSHKPIILLRRSSCGQIVSKYRSSSKRERDKKFLQFYTKSGNSKLDGNFYTNPFERPKSATATIGARSVTPINSIFASPAISVANIKQECTNEICEGAWVMQNNAANSFSYQQNRPNQNIVIKTENENFNPNIPNAANSFNSMTLPSNNQNFVQILPNQQIILNAIPVPVEKSDKNKRFILPNEMMLQDGIDNRIFIQSQGTASNSFIFPQCSNQMIASQDNTNALQDESTAAGVKYYLDSNNNIQTSLQERDPVFLQPSYSAPLRSGINLKNNNQYISNRAHVYGKNLTGSSKSNEPQPDDDSLTNITWLGRMGINSIMPVSIEKDKNTSLANSQVDRNGRPPYSYMALIQFAINSTPLKRMTLRQVYQWIEEKFPYFKSAKPGWKNSIRHNLSLHDIFVREVASGSKSSYWTLRSDLNQRPLTLDSMTGSTQHVFDNSTLSQICAPGQKTILPRQSYMIYPATQEANSKDCGDDADNSKLNHFQDSGFYSDLSNNSNFHISNDHCSLMQSSEKEYPMLSQATKSNNCKLNRKRSRKEPLKLLNDSLDSSVQFLKDSPFKVKASGYNNRTPKSLGISEESFSDIMNDLGSPFQTFFKNSEHLSCDTDKRFDLNIGLTPLSRKKRPRKQNVCILTPPSSKYSREYDRSRDNMENIDPSSDCITPKSKRMLQDTFGSPPQKSTPFTADKKQDKTAKPDSFSSKCKLLPETSTDFMSEFISSVFASPERIPTNFGKIESPIQVPLNEVPTNSTSNDIPQTSSSILPSIFGSCPDPATNLNTSFSKLLDISGISFLGGSMGSTTNYGDIADMSWSNLANLE